jgi:hypothetical protein
MRYDILCILYAAKYIKRSRDISVGIATRLQDGWQESGFDFRQGQEIFLFSTEFRLAFGPTHPSIQWVPVAFSALLKR